MPNDIKLNNRFKGRTTEEILALVQWEMAEAVQEECPYYVTGWYGIIPLLVPN